MAYYAFGARGRYQEAGRLLSPGQEEPRTPEIGHTISLGARDFVRIQPDYYSFDKLFDRVHALGGVTGFAHQAMSFHGCRGMALNTIRGKTDFLELAQFCVAEGPLLVQHYYEFLDMGFKLTALAGSYGQVALLRRLRAGLGLKGPRIEDEDSPLLRQFDVVIERDEEGYYVASVPQLPGCHTQAKSLDEVTQRIREAVELCLEVAGAPEQTLEFVGIQRITIAA